MRYQSPQTAIPQAGVNQQIATAATTPCRVLIIAPSPDLLGGQAVQGAYLVANLRAEDSLQISFLPINPRLPGLLARLQEIKYVRTIVTTLFYCLLLLWHVRTVDVVHVFSASYWSFLLAPTPAIFIAKLYGKKVLLNYRSGEAEDHLTNWRSALPIIRRADEVVVPSGYLVEVFGQFGVRAVSVPNTLDLSRFVFRPRQPLQPVLFSNRNFEPLYNVACVLRAFALIQRQFPQARLIVAGDGSQRDYLHKLAAELALKQVEFIGKVTQEAMPGMYDRADIYVNASSLDNMPVSLLEAFACGLPVVTTRAGGIPFIVTHNQTGLMADCNDHEALAHNVIRLLEDSALASRLSKAARAECEQYKWSAVRLQWLSLYQRK